MDDSQLLNRAAELGCVLFTQDDDLLAEAAKRQRASPRFHGVIYAHQLRTAIGTCVNDLEIIAKTADQEDLLKTVIFLPLSHYILFINISTTSQASQLPPS
jgi:hypothetical protein